MQQRASSHPPGELGSESRGRAWEAGGRGAPTRPWESTGAAAVENSLAAPQQVKQSEQSHAPIRTPKKRKQDVSRYMSPRSQHIIRYSQKVETA